MRFINQDTDNGRGVKPKRPRRLITLRFIIRDTYIRRDLKARGFIAEGLITEMACLIIKVAYYERGRGTK